MLNLSFRQTALCKAWLCACILVVLTGCVSHEGVSLGQAPKGAEELLRPIQADEDTDETQPTQGANGRELILVGTVSSLRRFNERSSARFYDSYAEFVEKMRPGSAASVSLTELRETFAGWTNLKSFTVPLLMGIYRDVLIPKNIAEEIYFPAPASVFLVQEAGDLLAAKTNGDGFFVVDARLCANGTGYTRCAREYKKGLFDAKTGERLDFGSLEPEENAVRIDLQSYKLIDTK